MFSTMQIDPILLAAAAITFFIGGLLKGTMGFGLPILAIPILTIVGSLPFALSVAVPPAIATNFWQIWKFRKHGETKFLTWFLVPGAIGLFAGAYLLSYVNEAYLKILLGCMVLFFLFQQGKKGEAILPSKIRDILSPIIGFLSGLVHGSLGLSGLVATPFFNAAGFARPAFIFCSSVMFSLYALLHLPALAAAGLYQSSSILIGLIIILPAFAGLWLGGKYGEKLDAASFRKLVRIVLAFSAILPIWNGISQLLS